jgi:NAD(P)-dependent dehydrogenase (short-subunit alcohol dehydrogenase family)
VLELHVVERRAEAGPVACVSGAAGNIGRAIGRRLAEDGFHVVATVFDGTGADRRAGHPLYSDRETGEALGAEEGWDVLACDLAEEADCRELVSWIGQRRGQLDCLVNNAATWSFGSLAETTDADWSAVFEVNVFAVARMVREAQALMRESDAPRVVNVGSTCGFLPEAGIGPYCVSKAAVHALTAWMAIELASDSILVNAVAPGFIDTSSNAQYMSAERLPGRLARIPVGRPGTAAEVAGTVSFLASPTLGFVTGVVLRCDGGQVAGSHTLPNA